MLVFFLFVQLLLIINYCHSFNIQENSERIKSILENYKTNLRHRRNSSNTTKYIQNALNFLKETERFGEFIKYYNVSECPDHNKGNSTYTKRHILYGLILDHSVPDTHWREYKSVFNKSYKTRSQERAALTAWRDNLQLVADHNKKYMKGRQSYALHLNLFGDLPGNDYVKKLLKLIKTVRLPDPAEDLWKTAFKQNRYKNVPKRVDWREKGYRPKREEQWLCGACYAFAVAHALQAQMFKKHRQWRELSPQQIVDCSGVDGNLGCEGGSLRATLRYAAREGLQPEIEYPYFGLKGRCRYNRYRIRARPKRWAMLPFGDERAMEKALATIGPLAVAVNASPRSFQLYRSGIYDDPFCHSLILNHAMLLVGYTPEYWVLLNWWGKRWGEDGYIRIRRGLNRCGVANMAAYVEIV